MSTDRELLGQALHGLEYYAALHSGAVTGDGQTLIDAIRARLAEPAESESPLPTPALVSVADTGGGLKFVANQELLWLDGTGVYTADQMRAYRALPMSKERQERIMKLAAKLAQTRVDYFCSFRDTHESDIHAARAALLEEVSR